jgi:hypothetical protein
MAAFGNICLILAFFCTLVLAYGFADQQPPTVGCLSNACRKTLFRPLRRVVRNFVTERRATITIVFQHSRRSREVPGMRWFRQVEPNTLPNAEIPDMISIDLRSIAIDRRYKLTTLSSHDVTAATLTIQPVPATSFPVKFVTCFNFSDEQFQYQLDTVIDKPTERANETLDGIIWQRAPPSNISFTPELTVLCEVKLESESSRFTDELNIYRNYLVNTVGSGGSSGIPQLTSAGCGKIHKDRDNYAEEAGKYTYEGRRRVLTEKRGQVVYEASFKIRSGTQDDIGVYTCAAERARDRTYVSSWVHPQTFRPVLIFLPCNDATSSNANARLYQVSVVAHRPTCVRCRVYGFRSTPITLTKNTGNVQSSATVLLDSHMNVADGGLNELTVNFLDPTQTDAGQYQCSVGNGAGREIVQFRLTVTAQ